MLHLQHESRVVTLYPKPCGDHELAIDNLRKQIVPNYAIIKDERYPTLDCFTGKTIRICSSDSLFGPYSNLSAPISPNFREAPMLIPSPNGKIWYLYYEQYPGWDKYALPPKVRHGCMLPISRAQYDELIEAFGSKSAPQKNDR